MKQGDIRNLIRHVIFKAWAEVSPDSAKGEALSPAATSRDTRGLEIRWAMCRFCLAANLLCDSEGKFPSVAQFLYLQILGYSISKVIPVLNVYIRKSKRDFITPGRKVARSWNQRALWSSLMHSLRSQPAFANCSPSSEGLDGDTRWVAVHGLSSDYWAGCDEGPRSVESISGGAPSSIFLS